jgi:hypothetical protein
MQLAKGAEDSRSELKKTDLVLLVMNHASSPSCYRITCRWMLICLSPPDLWAGRPFQQVRALLSRLCGDYRVDRCTVVP